MTTTKTSKPTTLKHIIGVSISIIPEYANFITVDKMGSIFIWSHSPEPNERGWRTPRAQMGNTQAEWIIDIWPIQTDKGVGAYNVVNWQKLLFNVDRTAEYVLLEIEYKPEPLPEVKQ